MAKADRADRNLQRFLLLGHASDMLFSCAQHVLKALGRWCLNENFCWEKPTSPVLGCLDSTLARWGWRRDRRTWGVWRGPGNVQWSVRAERKTQDKSAHDLRDSWHLCQVKLWNANSRNDSELARRERLQVSLPLITRLRKVAKLVDGHGVGIMVGAMSTDARWCPAFPRILRDYCYSCSCPDTPTVTHQHRGARPAEGLAQRLGWSGSLFRCSLIGSRRWVDH